MNKTVRRALHCTAFIALAGLAPSGIAFAQQQTPPAQTGIASPDRAREQFSPEQLVPRHIPQIEVREMQLKGAPEGAEKVTFTLNGLNVNGVTAYTQAEIAPLYNELIGSTISLADLYVIANDLTRKYRNDGYILTQVVVPPQTIDGGVPSLRVIEGFVAGLEVQSDEPDSATGLVRDYLSQVSTGGDAPLNVRELERALLLINDLPGMSARSILSPSKEVAGGADLLVILNRKSYDAMIGADNFGTRFLGPIQLSGAASLNSFFNANERLTGQVVIAPEGQELAYFALGYTMPVWKYGTTFTMGASNTFTEPGHELEQFEVRGVSRNANFGFSHPFIRSRETNLTGRITLDMSDVDTRNNLVGDPTRKDRIRNLRLGGRFEKLENHLGLAYNVFDFEVSKGLDLFGASHEGDADMSRALGDPQATTFEAEIQRLQRIAPSVNFLMAARGQLSTNALLSTEEFGFGGQNYGRGYDPSEIIGDEGIASKLELQINRPFEMPMFEDHQLYAFFDAGKVWNDDATTASQEEISRKSTGIGMRIDLNEVTHSGLMIALPLSKEPQTENNNGPRVYININREF